MEEIIQGLTCKIYEDNINIKDSYTVTKKSKMAEILKEIKEKHPECKVFEVRSGYSLLCEWTFHNRLYKLGIKKDQTGSTDLDIYEPWWRRLIYAIFGL